MVVTHPWHYRDMKRCRELERCGCTKISFGFGGQAAKTDPSPAFVHRGGDKDAPRDGKGDHARGSVPVHWSWPLFAAFPRLAWRPARPP